MLITVGKTITERTFHLQENNFLDLCLVSFSGPTLRRSSNGHRDCLP